MKKCFYCNRQILNGSRIIQDGIKYICNNNDIKICNDIRINKIENKKLHDYNKLQQYGGKHINCINCSCGISFYTNFPIETFPPCDDCPNCGLTHHSKIKL